MIALLFVGAYLLGSVPFGVLIARYMGVDIMSVGSGNIGATNVNRVLGWKVGMAVLLLDVAKALLPALLAWQLFPRPQYGMEVQTISFLAGTAAILGHCFSPWLGFRGGKGVATALGAVTGAAPLIAAGAFLVFATLLSTTRYMSLSSVFAVATALILGALLPGQTPQLIPVYGLLLIFVIWRHRENFRRIRSGAEPRFSFRRTKEAGP